MVPEKTSGVIPSSALLTMTEWRSRNRISLPVILPAPCPDNQRCSLWRGNNGNGKSSWVGMRSTRAGYEIPLDAQPEPIKGVRINDTDPTGKSDVITP
ncbi:MAG: hypothetical protein ACOYJQ_01480 [Pseudochelatococcus sp.]|jgi:hypothetical protein|uniref:hypothetical protein n=1 Tax=Pseudochelatococcus sp. TaxID=2020869 RepID=UPI003D9138AD